MREAKAVAGTISDLQSGSPASTKRIDSYVTNFGLAPTATNLDKLHATVCAAKAVACRKATASLSANGDVSDNWIDDALADDTPFAWEEVPADPLATIDCCHA